MVGLRVVLLNTPLQVQRRRIINKNNKDNSALHIGLTVFGLFEAGV